MDQLRAPSDARQIAPPVETTLDALDDTIEMLSALNVGGRGKARRGRIDLASLLVEIAPGARVAIEPGAGTEVFGEEVELRRMLHLLVAQASGRSPSESSVEVRIVRQGDFVRISADLGPDTAALGELESRWLARMALKHGGSVALEGATLSVLLQADGASDQREVHELRRELEQAQQLGETYARELASMLAAGDVRTEAPPPSRGDPERFEGVRSVAAATHRALKGLLEGARGDLERGAPSDALSRLASAQELVTELGGVIECDIEGRGETLPLPELLGQAVAQLEPRAVRGQVALTVEAPATANVRGSRPALDLLLRSLLGHALSATPRGGSVTALVVTTELGISLAVRDGGPPVPEASRWDVIRHRIDPTRLGRPAGVALVLADAAATALSAELELRDSPEGRTEAWVHLRKA